MIGVQKRHSAFFEPPSNSSHRWMDQKIGQDQDFHKFLVMWQNATYILFYTNYRNASSLAEKFLKSNKPFNVLGSNKDDEDGLILKNS